MEVKRLTTKMICDSLDGTLVVSINKVDLFYKHTPDGRGYYIADRNDNSGKFAGAEMRDACREFNRQLKFANKMHRTFTVDQSK